MPRAVRFPTPPPDPSDDDMLDIPAAAKRFGLSSWTVRRLIRRGELPTTRFGKLHRIELRTVKAFIAAHRSDRRDD